MSRSSALLGALALSGLIATALVGCASGQGEPIVTIGPGDSGGSGPVEDVDFSAAWLDGGRLIGLVTYGSSSKDCQPVYGETTYANGVLTVTVEAPKPDIACTADYVSQVGIVGVPEGVDPAQELEIELTGAATGDTDLNGADGLTPGDQTDYQPSAGWADDGEFVLLSWGSSSCRPEIDAVEPIGPAEVRVTFVTPPEDQVCTMDMAPRADVVEVQGLEVAAGAFAILTGAEFADVRVPILGTP
ncbi:hypothetical protein AB1K54_07155 [Microbacterium sp. BWT-B31]|uniref:hypothetical protein n=1 Tax=Microbacterium sp. BWT-B31 TaxID=3232072 RepID=UPI0035298646